MVLTWDWRVGEWGLNGAFEAWEDDHYVLELTRAYGDRLRRQDRRTPC